MHFSKRKGRSDTADGALNELGDGAMESDGREKVALRGSFGDDRAHPLTPHDLQNLEHCVEEQKVALIQYAGMLRDERLLVQRLRMERDGKAAEVEVLRACLLEATNLAAVTSQLQQQIEASAKHSSVAGATASFDEASAVEVEAIKQQKDALEIKQRAQLVHEAKSFKDAQQQKIEAIASVEAQTRDVGVLRAQLDVVEARAVAERARATSADKIAKIYLSNLQSQLGLLKAQVRVRKRLNPFRCLNRHHGALSDLVFT